MISPKCSNSDNLRRYFSKFSRFHRELEESLTPAPSLVTLAPRSLPPEGKGILLNTETQRHKVF